MSLSKSANYEPVKFQHDEFQKKLKTIFREIFEPLDELRIFVSIEYQDGISRSNHDATFEDLGAIGTAGIEDAFLEINWKYKVSEFCMLTMSWGKVNWYISLDYPTVVGVTKFFAMATNEFKLVKGWLETLGSAPLLPEKDHVTDFIENAARKLRKLIRNRPPSERIVQDTFEDLLNATDTPYEREIVQIQYSAKAFRPDFVLRQYDLAVELKICASAERVKTLVDEINADIPAYLSKFKSAAFLIYDIGCISDIHRFCEVFERNKNVSVRVIKH